MVRIDECPVRPGDIIYTPCGKKTVMAVYRDNELSVEWHIIFKDRTSRLKQILKYLFGLRSRNIAEWGHTKIRMNARAVGWK